jgi:hypothetical protein
MMLSVVCCETSAPATRGSHHAAWNCPNAHRGRKGRPFWSHFSRMNFGFVLLFVAEHPLARTCPRWRARGRRAPRGSVWLAARPREVAAILRTKNCPGSECFKRQLNFSLSLPERIPLAYTLLTD